jgi:hypothetical protein
MRERVRGCVLRDPVGNDRSESNLASQDSRRAAIATAAQPAQPLPVDVVPSAILPHLRRPHPKEKPRLPAAPRQRLAVSQDCSFCYQSLARRAPRDRFYSNWKHFQPRLAARTESRHAVRHQAAIRLDGARRFISLTTSSTSSRVVRKFVMHARMLGTPPHRTSVIQAT